MTGMGAMGAFMVALLLTSMRPADDYYSRKNGKLLGTDGALTDRPRMISEELFNRIQQRYFSTVSLPATKMLEDSSVRITIDNNTIQADLQKVRDLSMNGNEHQLYIILDLKRALVTSIMSTPGTNSGSAFTYYPAPGLQANMPVAPNGKRMTFAVILAGVHGHPDPEIPFMVTLPTMSPDYDAVVARNRQVPIYGVDAMSYTGLSGSRGKVHRANPDGSIDNAVGWTAGHSGTGFNIGLDALRIWGRSGTPEF